ncbi:unnamed protein product [Spirodela intermedia]|uniref:Uncharacterized protein n=1 Tax=Spirodela intermedia TaxID=51605 RepID=A0A7I8JC94_SPIIN|nr:unnamed protein product [Spirodela intermedia]CAA6667601.1 unnamed protein product [Spirodela intermedia]
MAMFGGEGGGGFSAGYPATGYPPLAPYAAAATRCPGAPPPMQAGWSGEENRIFEGRYGFRGRVRGRWSSSTAAWRRTSSTSRPASSIPLSTPTTARTSPAPATQSRVASPSLGEGQTRGAQEGGPWTEDEHKRFLEGLEKYGKGDWRSISRNSVVTRTPTQVASHAQKYFLRLNTEGKKERRRSSIHDVTRT